MSAWTKISATKAASSSVAFNPFRISMATSFNRFFCTFIKSILLQSQEFKNLAQLVELHAGDPSCKLNRFLLLRFYPLYRFFQNGFAFVPINHDHAITIAKDQISGIDYYASKESWVIDQTHSCFRCAKNAKSTTEHRPPHFDDLFGISYATVDSQSPYFSRYR